MGLQAAEKPVAQTSQAGKENLEVYRATTVTTISMYQICCTYAMLRTECLILALRRQRKFYYILRQRYELNIVSVQY